ncbi:hypothetical protein RhiirA5_428933 [Rhizophagus irregularis]|uniref:Uncharacterized protein n=2 Tax=Rhizophagus irregularis TaxID=588596 RepID=A0A2N0NZE1_9GLOM|nr:hypothetical protein RhiirA5_428933 [Rhizophagus irregularis]GET55497.1 nitrate transporter [Rhizophagus irregularis DAOM 181602=DAOM 197198]CAB5207585.1 unnamed protein product [Rhizophagus irregularis]CAG8727038.1 2283_t:CDS:2 [Rhizophagus irregularis]
MTDDGLSADCNTNLRKTTLYESISFSWLSLSHSFHKCDAAIFFRFLGPLCHLCDHFGPKRVMHGSIAYSTVGLSAIVRSPIGLITVCFFTSILGATFVPCQFWTTRMFSKNIVGSATAVIGGLGVLVLLFIFLA